MKPSHHWLIFGNPSVYGDVPECAANYATRSAAKNQYGDRIRVTCCDAATGAGSRPREVREVMGRGGQLKVKEECVQRIPWAQAQAHCESFGLGLCTRAEIRAGAGWDDDPETSCNGDMQMPVKILHRTFLD